MKKISPYIPKNFIAKKKLVFADIETIIKKKHQLACICLIDGDTVLHFLNINEFMNYIFEHCYDKIIYFHNFGRFDCIFILDYLVKNKIDKVNIIERNNIIYEIKKKVSLLDIDSHIDTLYIKNLDYILKSFYEENNFNLTEITSFDIMITYNNVQVI